jgi:hypothetical protein
MSDAHLRELERTWRQRRTADDEARWLAARVQHGATTREGLDLAAWLGHEAAALAAGRALCPETRLPLGLRSGRAGFPGRRDLVPWAGGFDRFGRPCARRVVVALLTRHVERLAGRPALRPARACWEAAILYTLSPGDADVRRRLAEVVARVTPAGRPDDAFQAVARLAYGLVVDLLGRAAPRVAAVGDLQALVALKDPGERWLELEALRSAVAGQVVPWALGVGDPLVDLCVRPDALVELEAPCPMPVQGLRRRERRLACTVCQVEVLEPGEAAGRQASVMHRRRASDGRTLARACLAALAPPPARDVRLGRRGEPLPRRWASADELERAVMAREAP